MGLFTGRVPIPRRGRTAPTHNSSFSGRGTTDPLDTLVDFLREVGDGFNGGKGPRYFPRCLYPTPGLHIDPQVQRPLNAGRGRTTVGTHTPGVGIAQRARCRRRVTKDSTGGGGVGPLKIQSAPTPAPEARRLFVEIMRRPPGRTPVTKLGSLTSP